MTDGFTDDSQACLVYEMLSVVNVERGDSGEGRKATLKSTNRHDKHNLA